MIIKDIVGHELTLDKKFLSEAPFLDGYAVSLREIRARFKEAKAASNKIADLNLLDTDMLTDRAFGDRDFLTSINFATLEIGCRMFDKKTFNKILRAAGAKN